MRALTACCRSASTFRRSLKRRNLFLPSVASPSDPAALGHILPERLEMDGVGAVAQLGERCPRTAEVRGSNPLRSTNPGLHTAAAHRVHFDWFEGIAAFWGRRGSGDYGAIGYVYDWA